MDTNADNDILQGAVHFFGELTSRGYGEAHARLLTLAQASIARMTQKLSQHKRQQGHAGDRDVDIVISTGDDGVDDALLHDDALLPGWKKFADELASATPADRGHIGLTLIRMQMERPLWNLLLKSFRGAPLRYLMLKDNNLNSEGMTFIVNALEMNHDLKDLYIGSNPIESDEDASALVGAVKKHPRVHCLALDNCGLGRHDSVMEAVVPALHFLKQVSLKGNIIGLPIYIKMISKCLASNPMIEHLDLDDNIIADDGALILSQSLKTNTKLRVLRLAKNQITRVGIESLFRSVWDFSSLNAAYESNHTCRIDVGEEHFYSNLKEINKYVDQNLNRRVKIFNTLEFHILYLSELPLGLMPRVLAFVQDAGSVEIKRLSETFHLVRKWNMPLLFTSRIDLGRSAKKCKDD